MIEPLEVAEAFGVPRGFLGWERTFGAWYAVTPAFLLGVGQGEAREFVLSEVRARLEEAGAVPVGPFSFQVVDPSFRADYFTRNVGSVLLGEVRGLVLRVPSPFPVLVPFPRVEAGRLRLVRLRRRVRGRWATIRGLR